MNEQRLDTAANNGSGTVAKAFQIIRYVTSSPRHSVTVSEIAEELSLPRPTANRLISNLIKLGMLKRDGGGTRIIEGDELLHIAGDVLEGAASRGPRHEILRQLVIDTRETANVGAVSSGQIVYLDRVEAIWPLAFRLDVGSRVPLHCSAIGKVLLSKMPQAQRRKYLDAIPLSRRTANTICERDALEAELDIICESGVAIDNEECFEGVIGIAVPVLFKQNQHSMGLALVAPSARQTLDGLRDFLPAMRTAAAGLARCYPD
ncbi:MAG: IclR family transcriptional regulator [Pseudomonadota bacterium]|uniref:IclR family transcriptional regulator n=1 Tax=Roseovarius TaxID=74030 RepID=UPI0022A744A3|nr:IclR family transcriptional regulator [Roseovarius sp. EGI FJ00037]MCZ0811635.1 IclR family transcriptional regulator [Roseovarius sp. EGI FJ00037]